MNPYGQKNWPTEIWHESCKTVEKGLPCPANPQHPTGILLYSDLPVRSIFCLQPHNLNMNLALVFFPFTCRPFTAFFV